MSAENNAHSPIGKFVALPGLFERVLAFLDLSYDPIDRLRLVCRHWAKHVAPFQFRSMSLWPSSRTANANLIRLYGFHIESLVCGTIANEDLKLVAECCPNLKSLLLYARSSSFWTSYASLERFFISLRSAPLTSVHVDFDLSHFDASFFWSLSQLPCIEELTLRTYATRPCKSPLNAPKVFASFLECCPTLKVFHFWYRLTSQSWYNPSRPKGIVERLLKKTLESKKDGVPVSLDEALARRIQNLSDMDKSINSPGRKGKNQRYQGSFSPKAYQLSRLDFKPDILDISTLHQIARKLHYLEELDMRGFWKDIPLETWTILSTHCQCLHLLRIHLQGANKGAAPTISDFVSLFPRLQTLELQSQQFDSDPDLSTLSSVLRQHEVKYSVPHPLKSLSIIGTLKQPAIVLVHALTHCNTSLESLTVTNLQDDQSIMTACMPISSPEPQGSIPHFDSTVCIPCQGILRNLCISEVNFRSHAQTIQFFTRLQGFNRLATLHISLIHLRSLIISPLPLPEFITVGGARSAQKTIIKQGMVGRGPDGQLTFNYSFPSVHVLKVTMHGLEQRPRPDLEYYETRLFISAFPSLTDLHLQIPSNVDHTQVKPVRFLKAMLPKVNVTSFVE
ncbi:hypothetical protein FBU30_004103 [Linnemannia zychae]|nr:hypothetical protein FBU30_004103 [Linnemannia zychae]